MKITARKEIAKDIPELILKSIQNINDYELSPYRWIREYQIALIEFLEEVSKGVIDGLAIKLGVDPNEIHKSISIPQNILLKASSGEDLEDVLLYKGLFDGIRKKFKNEITAFKKFWFNRGKPVEPMKINGNVFYNPETKKMMTNRDFESLNKDVIKYLGDRVESYEDEMIVRASMFGLLKMQMDKDGIPEDEQKKYSYKELQKKYKFSDDIEEIKPEIEKKEKMKQAIEYAKNHGAEYLSIPHGKLKNNLVNMMRKQIVGGLQDGISAKELISRLYWIDPEDVLGKKFIGQTLEHYNRDLRRIAVTEMQYAMNEGYLMAHIDKSEPGEKLYFVYSGSKNPKEKPEEPCNSFIGKIGLMSESSDNDISEDEYADYKIWPGKTNVGRKKSNWWFCCPTHPHCYDKETEIYTENGWKFIKDVKIGEKCLSLNPNTKNLEYVKVIKTIKNKEKELLRFYNKISDSVVTKQHKMFYQRDNDRKKKTGIFNFVNAEDIFEKKSGRFYAGSEWIGKEKQINDLWYEFFGYYLSDGSSTKQNNNYLISIFNTENKNPKQHKKIQKCLSKLFPNINLYIGKTNIRFYNKKLGKYLNSIGKCNVKYIPNFIMDSKSEKIRIFLDAFLSCDGYTRTRKSNFKNIISTEKIYFTTSKKMSDQIGELILKIGKRPSYSIQKQKGKINKFKNGEYKSNFDIFKISENNHLFIDFGKMNFEKIQYNDFVYCVELETNHTLWTKRNGKTVWQGNCRHNWQRIYPKSQKWNHRIDKLEYKSTDLKTDLIKSEQINFKHRKEIKKPKDDDPIVKKINFNGLPIDIEWKKGEIREYIGSKYKNKMNYDYGYIRNTNSPDGMEIDVCVNVPRYPNAKVYILSQLCHDNDNEGDFDEYKYMLGFKSKKQAKKKYIKTMEKDMYGGINEMTFDNFKKNLVSFYKTKNKPLKKSKDIYIDNIEWETKTKTIKSELKELSEKIKKELNIKTPIIVHLYKNKSIKNADDRAEYDEGVIILYENSPDWRGDFIHELGHQLFRKQNISEETKNKLNKLKKELEKNKGDNRIFIQEHTYSNISEIFSTIFKWFISGKYIDDSYMKVLNDYCSEGKKILEEIINKNELEK